MIAQGGQCAEVAGDRYLPPDAADRAYLQPSDTRSTCGWKGVASYFHLVVDGKVNRDAAGHYPDPKSPAKQIAGRIASWRGVMIEP